ncbi:MAG: tRNA (guanine(10)-N(2))-dimethyltransferase [Sulfolobales archaeon]
MSIEIREFECPKNLETVREGLASICAPKKDLYVREDGVFEPAWAPVFYNPIMSMNRDATILFLRVVSKRNRIRRASDLMSATGVRGIRIALETPVEEIFMGDIDPYACYITSINTRLNSVHDRTRIFCSDYNITAVEIVRGGIKVDFNDLDPYGSPAPFIDSAIELVKRGGFLSVTATDIASLSGSYPLKALRRYGSKVLRTDFSKEVGIRVLIGFIVRRGAEKDRVLKPLISFYSDHYYKILFEVNKSAGESSRNLEKLGYYRYCSKCFYRDIIRLEDLGRTRDFQCPYCGGKLNLIGPLWLGEIWSREIIELMLRELEETPWIGGRFRRLLEIIESEADIETPYHYTTGSIASTLKKSQPPLSSVLECLARRGFKASRTHFSSIGFRTDAEFKDVIDCFRNTSRY